MPHERVPENRRNNAKRMRKAMTDAERRLWNQLRAHRLIGLGFRRQMPIGSFIADFACAEARMVVEVDGSQHAIPDRAIRDAKRSRQLAETGWLVIRFWNDEVLHELDDVCEHIVRVAVQRKEHPPLSPPVTQGSRHAPLPVLRTPPQGGRVALKTLSGGCQCGAVRFRVTGNPGTSSVCHCRMCQKASAAPFLALVGPGDNPVEWTRGQPAWFQSSSAARRGFCAACGTPLAYDAPDGLALTVLAFDDPDAVAPTIAYGVEGKRPWCDAVPDLPQRVTMDDIGEAPFLETLKNFQHPDHDTGEWPPNADR